MTVGTTGPRGGRLIPLHDADLHVYDVGRPDGPALVLVHGFLTSAYTWRLVYPALARDHRVLLVDLPGSGHSPDLRDQSQWTADRCADLLVQLLDALGLATATVIGTQMGGSVAAWFAARNPDRAARLVVLAAGALGETSTNLRLYRLLAAPRIGPRLARFFPRARFEERWLAAHGPAHRLDPAATDYYFEQLRCRGHVMARFGLGVRLSYGESFDALARPLRGLAVPTLLLFGNADPLVPPMTGRRFQELLADARLVVLPDCGDFPQEEQPDRVVSEILGFLGEQRPGPG
jgi:pimeloyl-ACP methyl ester carboxylesterase